ncbi:MAG: RiPP maturation radical SAM C-methyltransferase [Pyrinomonadaceae bacterium]
MSPTGVLFANMPFSGADRPQIGISLLKAALRARNIPCDIRYFNITFAEWIGPETYQWYSSELDHTIFAGEWVFAHQLFGESLLKADRYLQYLREKLKIDEQTIRIILNVRRRIDSFLDYCLRSVDWEQYSIIGFTSTFEQNAASLALARAIKELYPNKIIVMGGANCEAPMGEALHRCFPFVDYIFSGEADSNFPEFVERLLNHQSVDDLPGLVYRKGEKSVFNEHAAPVQQMDTLPFPDYSDYFEQFFSSPISKKISPMLQIETSRGCWWGAKHHCTFCGLNALSMSFRSKSKERALEEILYLVSRYGVKQIAAVDNIMDSKYFRDLLPELKRRNLGLSLFYEVKANMTKEQVRMLAEAGVTMIQPGIESLHKHMLQLMRKGVAPLQNVQLLKWCAELGVRASWNLLYGFPGETEQDYEEMLPLLESITHLQPPDGHGSIRLDRFSPYFQNPAEFGLVNARPLEIYRYIYPFPENELAEIAYFYQYEFADGKNPKNYIKTTLNQLTRWHESSASGKSLRSQRLSNDGLEIVDTRSGKSPKRVRLSEWHKDLYEFCDQMRSLSTIEKWLQNHTSNIPLNEAKLFLDDLIEMKLMCSDEQGFLSLAIPAKTETTGLWKATTA